MTFLSEKLGQAVLQIKLISNKQLNYNGLNKVFNGSLTVILLKLRKLILHCDPDFSYGVDTSFNLWTLTAGKN